MGLDLFQKESIWTLTSLDKPSKVIEGQYRPNNLTENVSGSWSETSTMGMDHPVLQFVRGNLDTISFDAKVFAENEGFFGTGLGAKEIKDIVDEIRDLPRADPEFGRPHVYTLTWTEDFQQDVVVRSVGGIRYDNARPEGLLRKSSLRGVLFRLDLARYTPYNVADLVGAAESLIIYVKEGDTYESIAKRTYGDARLGEVLRRRNPGMLNPAYGDRLHIPPKVTARRELDLNMAALPFRRGTNQTDLFNAVLDKRSAPRRTHVFRVDI